MEIADLYCADVDAVLSNEPCVCSWFRLQLHATCFTCSCYISCCVEAKVLVVIALHHSSLIVNGFVLVFLFVLGVEPGQQQLLSSTVLNMCNCLGNHLYAQETTSKSD